MNTDLYLRSKAKTTPADLWLHPAGPDGTTPPPPPSLGVPDGGLLTVPATAFRYRQRVASTITLAAHAQGRVTGTSEEEAMVLLA